MKPLSVEMALSLGYSERDTSSVSQTGIKFTKAKELLRSYCLIYILCKKESPPNIP